MRLASSLAARGRSFGEAASLAGPAFGQRASPARQALQLWSPTRTPSVAPSSRAAEAAVSSALSAAALTHPLGQRYQRELQTVQRPWVCPLAWQRPWQPRP
jgi:hypothetical protein